MNKKILLLTLVATILALTFISCASENTLENNSNEITSETDNEVAEETNESFTEPAEEANESPTEPTNDISNENTNDISPFSSEEIPYYTETEIKELLGEGKEELNNLLGVENGGKTIEYNDATIQMILEVDNEYYTYAMSIKNNKIPHPRNITIGDDVSSVLNKFFKFESEDKIKADYPYLGEIDGIHTYNLCQETIVNTDLGNIIGLDGSGNVKTAKFTTELSSMLLLFDNNKLVEIKYHTSIN